MRDAMIKVTFWTDEGSDVFRYKAHRRLNGEYSLIEGVAWGWLAALRDVELRVARIAGEPVDPDKRTSYERLFAEEVRSTAKLNLMHEIAAAANIDQDLL